MIIFSLTIRHFLVNPTGLSSVVPRETWAQGEKFVDTLVVTAAWRWGIFW